MQYLKYCSKIHCIHFNRYSCIKNLSYTTDIFRFGNIIWTHTLCCITTDSLLALKIYQKQQFLFEVLCKNKRHSCVCFFISSESSTIVTDKSYNLHAGKVIYKIAFDPTQPSFLLEIAKKDRKYKEWSLGRDGKVVYSFMCLNNSQVWAGFLDVFI